MSRHAEAWQKQSSPGPTAAMAPPIGPRPQTRWRQQTRWSPSRATPAGGPAPGSWKRAGRESRAAARSQLIRALEIATALKTTPLRTDVERVAARAHLSTDRCERPAPRPSSGTSDLTPRELEVLELVATGQSNREIGEALFITEKTAGVHVSNVLGKLGVSRRTEAVAVARERGLLET